MTAHSSRPFASARVERGLSLFALACLLTAASARAESDKDRDKDKPQLVVSPLIAQGAAEAEAGVLPDAVVQSLAERGYFRVLSSQDIQTILGTRRQREILGACGEDGKACAADLGQALGARFVMTGSLGRIGSTYQLSLQTLDTQKGVSIG